MASDAPLIDPEAVAARAQELWRAARERETRRLDVYVKIASRVRASRDRLAAGSAISRARETGTAVRLVDPRAPVARFAACTGATVSSLRWALAAAASLPPGADPAMPGRGAIVEADRRDLDHIEPLPDESDLAAWLAAHPQGAWIECGVTIEALVGDEGWRTLRRRSRTWALLEEGRPRLVAARGYRFAGDPAFESLEETRPRGQEARTRGVCLAPAAAATVVAAVARGVHADPSLAGRRVAPAWRLADDPLDPKALFGGTFDDAGFPSARRVLADGRSAVSVLGGPGTYRRGSYRDAPVPGHSHLVVAPAEEPTAEGGQSPITRCRVIPLGRDRWLLQLDQEPHAAKPFFVGVEPGDIPLRCIGTWGRPVLAADGVMTPGLVLGILRG